MLFTGLSRPVCEKTVPLVLSTALGLRLRAVLKTSWTVFSHTDLPPGKYNIYICDLFSNKAMLFECKSLGRSKVHDENSEKTKITKRREWLTVSGF